MQAIIYEDIKGQLIDIQFILLRTYIVKSFILLTLLKHYRIKVIVLSVQQR